MPITGQESTLAGQLHDAIKSAIEAAFGGEVRNPEYILALSTGISNAIIPFLVSNVQLNPGQTTLSTGVTGPTAAPGAPTPIPALTGSVTTPGTIS